MAPTPASFPEAPFHSLRTPLRSEAEEAVDNLVQTANSRRQAILDELGLIRRDEREGQRALIAIQRETLVQAESTIRLLHQQVRSEVSHSLVFFRITPLKKKVMNDVGARSV